MKPLRLNHLLVACILFFVATLPSVAVETFSAKVIGVSDGDTITILRGEKEQIKVRFHGIDAPEKGQPWGTQAKKACSDLCFGKIVSIEAIEKDRYGRTIAVITTAEKINVNQELVKRGLAWWYRQYAPKSEPLKALEQEAREAKRGLWSDADPIPPWEWRSGKKNNKSNPRPQQPASKTAAVYIAPKGDKYHMKTCRYVKEDASAISLSEAKSKGYTPCKVCDPPQ